MIPKGPKHAFHLVVALGFVLALLPSLSQAQVIVKVNDNVNFKFGFQLQTWADWTQDPNSQGYSENLFIRRIRILLAGNLAKNLSFFYETDQPRSGFAGTDGNKNVSSGFLTQDAFAEYKIAGNALMLDAGLFLVPTSRNGLTSTQSFLAFDLGTWALQGNGIMKGNGGRDYGFGLKGYVADNHLEYRLAAFQGNRSGTTPQKAPLGPEAGSRNSFRIGGRVAYDFLDPEMGYVYAGTYRGAKKVIAVGAWGDGQGDYKAYGGDFAIDLPTVGKDTVNFSFDYDHFDGGKSFSALAKQNDIYSDAGYNFSAINVQPFVVYQKLNFSDTVKQVGNQQRYGGGLNWNISGQNLKLSLLYQRIVPKTKPVTAKTKDFNEFSIQLQTLYF